MESTFSGRANNIGFLVAAVVVVGGGGGAAVVVGAAVGDGSGVGWNCGWGFQKMRSGRLQRGYKVVQRLPIHPARTAMRTWGNSAFSLPSSIQPIEMLSNIKIQSVYLSFHPSIFLLLNKSPRIQEESESNPEESGMKRILRNNPKIWNRFRSNGKRASMRQTISRNF